MTEKNKRTVTSLSRRASLPANTKLASISEPGGSGTDAHRAGTDPTFVRNAPSTVKAFSAPLPQIQHSYAAYCSSSSDSLDSITSSSGPGFSRPTSPPSAGDIEAIKKWLTISPRLNNAPDGEDTSPLPPNGEEFHSYAAHEIGTSFHKIANLICRMLKTFPSSVCHHSVPSSTPTIPPPLPAAAAEPFSSEMHTRLDFHDSVDIIQSLSISCLNCLHYFSGLSLVICLFGVSFIALIDPVRLRFNLLSSLCQLFIWCFSIMLVVLQITLSNPSECKTRPSGCHSEPAWPFGFGLAQMCLGMLCISQDLPSVMVLYTGRALIGCGTFGVLLGLYSSLRLGGEPASFHMLVSSLGNWQPHKFFNGYLPCNRWGREEYTSFSPSSDSGIIIGSDTGEYLAYGNSDGLANAPNLNDTEPAQRISIADF